MEQTRDCDEEKARAVDLSTEELVRAKTLLLHHVYGLIGHTTIKCAMDLDIPDVVDSRSGRPITISELSTTLPKLHPSKAKLLPRVMRLLTQLGFFSTQSVSDDGGNQDQGYVLTPMSKLLVKNNPLGLAKFVEAAYQPFSYKALYHMSDWLGGPATTCFEQVHGRPLWDFFREDPEVNRVFNEGMASESSLEVELMVRECSDIFQAIGSLVDVGGGTGATAKALAKAFPGLQCTVLDLPHVAAAVPEGDHGGITFVPGDMFQHIPQADVILLKRILHDWNDDDCVRILKKCKEAVVPRGGKVIAVDIVVGCDKNNRELFETQLFSDVLMMTNFSSFEREEEEWRGIISRAGFTSFTIRNSLGPKSLLEIYP